MLEIETGLPSLASPKHTSGSSPSASESLATPFQKGLPRLVMASSTGTAGPSIDVSASSGGREAHPPGTATPGPAAVKRKRNLPGTPGELPLLKYWGANSMHRGHLMLQAAPTLLVKNDWHLVAGRSACQKGASRGLCCKQEQRRWCRQGSVHAATE